VHDVSIDEGQLLYLEFGVATGVEWRTAADSCRDAPSSFVALLVALNNFDRRDCRGLMVTKLKFMSERPILRSYCVL
jgi:hypothetical protein